MSFKSSNPSFCAKRSHFLWLLFLCKNAADAQKVSAADLPGRDVSVFVFVSFVSECVRLVCGLSEVIVYG